MYSDDTCVINAEDDLGGQMGVEFLVNMRHRARHLEAMTQIFLLLNLGQRIAQETVASEQI